MSTRSEHWALACARYCLAVLALLSLSCSLQGVRHEECQTNAECGALFGVGSVCSADGLCSAPQSNPRCTEAYPEDLFENPVEHRDTIVFGTLFNRENTAQLARQQSVRLAIAQINREGGLEGRLFGLVSCNTAPLTDNPAGDTLPGSLEAARYLVDTLELPALLGPSSSADVGAVFEEVRDRGPFVISPSATSPALTSVDQTSPTDEHPGLLWRTAPPDSVQGEVIALDMVARNITSVSVISQTGAYGEGLRGVFQQSFPGAVDLHVFSNTNQLIEATTLVGNGTAQEVLFIASAQDEVINFLDAAASSVGFAAKTLFLTDSAATQETLERGPRPIFPRIRGTRPRPLDPRDTVYSTFVAGYAAEYQSDVTQLSFTSHAYDMAWITALGAGWALGKEGEITGASIARGARHLSSGPELPLTPGLWTTALQSFRTGDAINIRGASGALDYSLATEETSAPIDVWFIDTTTEAPRIVTRSE